MGVKMEREKQIEEIKAILLQMVNCERYDEIKCIEDCKKCYATQIYNAGYRKERQGEWISVEDRMPQENEKVLAINSDGEIFIATYLIHKVSPSARGYMTWASGLWNGIPTHWQPLPQPPKMKGAE